MYELSYEDIELLVSIERKGRMIKFLQSYRDQLVNEARARGIPEEQIVLSMRVANVSDSRRQKNRQRH